MLHDEAGVVLIGQRYLEQQRARRPGEPSATRDAAVLAGALGLPPGGLAPLSDGALENERQRLLALRREDFRQGRVDELSGWILSHTELRLAALVALASAARP